MYSVYAENPHTIQNTENLREVETVFDAKQINTAQKNGAICVARRREINPDLNLTSLLLRNRDNKEYITVPEREYYERSGPVSYDESAWELIQEVQGYARPSISENNWGAYILPADAKVGERFFIKKLIEDLVASKFWYSVTPAETAIATWDGTNLVIDHSSYSFQLVG